MLKFTVHITAVHLFTCVAKAVTSRRSREYQGPGLSYLSRHLTGLMNLYYPGTASFPTLSFLFFLLALLAGVHCSLRVAG